MDKLSHEDSTAIAANEKPTPADFDAYLPWACKELEIDVYLDIIRVQSQEKTYGLKRAKSKTKGKKSIVDLISSKHEVIGSDKDSIKSLDDKKIIDPENKVKIYATYDYTGNNLFKLKFDKNKKIHRKVFKLIGLILHYHKHMTSITVNSGLDNTCLYELNKWLVLANNITDVCLDSTALRDGNYDLLLKDMNKLKHLSMSRCNINDATVNRIAINLTHPLPASKTLLVLNLASNLITDTGAKYLAVALRTNRQLVYLNLAGNTITDKGAGEIFDVLTNFLVTDEEMKTFRSKNMQYIKEKNNLIAQIVQEIKNTDSEKYSKKKPKSSTITQTSLTYKKGKDVKDYLKIASNTELDMLWLEKAKIIANNRMNELIEPFSEEYVYVEDGQIYCYGNNRVANINVSYNNIGYFTVKKILLVLLEQQTQNRKPRGLVNVSLEGNFIPSRCTELEQIDYILSSNIHFKSFQGKAKK